MDSHLKIGRYCIQISDTNYYDALNHTVIAENELESSCLLAGQEKSAITNYLNTLVPASIVIIPSFECNLRCPHCYVSSKLKIPSGKANGDCDPDKIIDFMARVRAKHGLIRYYFVGGEPLLHTGLIGQIIGAFPGLSVGMTTNGVWNFDVNRDLLNKFTDIAFSIDGLPDDHNRARKSLDKYDDVFGITYKNLRRAVKELDGVNIHVQGSMVGHQYADNEIIRYYALMLLAGVKKDNIKLGTVSSTDRWSADGRDLVCLQNQFRSKPCCDFSLGRNYTIVGDDVYSSYYRIGEIEPLGKVTDGIDELLDAYRTQILTTMPILKDDVCMNECAGVGTCWGFCTNSRHVFKNQKPSSVCNRPGAEAKTRELAEKARINLQLCHKQIIP